MNSRRLPIKRIFFALAVVVLLIGAAWTTYRLASGKGLNIRSRLTSVQNIARSALDHDRVIAANKGEYTNILFVHHSVGHNLIEQGKLREEMTALGYSFWNQDYIAEGLKGPDGKPAGYSYDIPGDNTDVDGYATIFRQPVFGLPVNAFSAFLQHEVILFKSCFPNSNIPDDAALAYIQQEYLNIRETIRQHPDRFFILLTSPPLNPAETDAASARRARALAQWLASPDFTRSYPNLVVFDLYGLLAEGNQGAPDANMLKPSYREGSDSHPNLSANLAIAPQLARFVKDQIDLFRKK